MKIGIYLPQVGPRGTAASVTRVATCAEREGFDSLWVFDHVVLQREQQSRYPYAENGQLGIPPTLPFLEPLTLLSFAAAVTQRVELGVGVLVLPMRQPVLHAKILASLDVLSGGRAILGAGVGWWKEEFEVLSVPFAHRGRRMDECLEVLRQCWTRDFVDFRGEFYEVVDWACSPKPARPIPIWMGGRNEAQLRRAGEQGDGWLANPAMLDSLEKDFDRCREYAVAAGRSAEKLVLGVNRCATLSASGLEAAAEELHRLRGKGVGHAIALLDPGDPDPESLIRAFASDYLPALQR